LVTALAKVKTTVEPEAATLLTATALPPTLTTKLEAAGRSEEAKPSLNLSTSLLPLTELLLSTGDVVSATALPTGALDDRPIPPVIVGRSLAPAMVMVSVVTLIMLLILIMIQIIKLINIGLNPIQRY
jgi:hypothetical protein